MDEKTAGIRIEYLEMIRKEVEDELGEIQQRAEYLTDKLKVMDGQIAEREIDVAEAQGPRLNNMGWPILESKEELERAIANRKKPPAGIESEEELGEKRQEVYRREAIQRIETLEDEE